MRALEIVGYVLAAIAIVFIVWIVVGTYIVVFS